MRHHFAIPVKELKKSEEFYKALGFIEINRWEKSAEKLSGILLEKDDCKIELIYHSTNLDFVMPKVVEVLHLGLQVEGLADLLVGLKSRGAEIAKPITKGVTVKQFAFIRDPNGFAIELFEV